MSRSSLQFQIGILTALRMVCMFLISIPVIVIYWQSHGLSMQDIFVLQVIFSIAIVILEIPSGYLADRIGNKNTMLIGSIAAITGFTFYWQLPSYGGFVTAELLLAVSASCVSGARDALLHDLLSESGETGQYTKLQGRLMAFGNVSEAVAALSAGVIASTLGVSAVLVAQLLVLSLTLPLTLLLRDPGQGKVSEPETLAAIMHYVWRGNPQLRSLNLFSGILGASTLTMVWFAQPHWRELGVDLLYFGVLWAGLNLVVAFGSLIAHHLETRVRLRTLFSVLALGPLFLYGLMSMFSTSLIALAVVPLFWLFRGITFPIISDYVQHEARAGNRATVLSTNALSTRLVFSICSPFLGWVADVWSFGTAFLTASCVFGVLSLIGLTLWLKARLAAHT